MEVIKINIVTFLKSNQHSRKIFGKRELKIIEKQLNGINLTQSEKNRLSRDIRPKFNFILEACKFSEDFDIKKAAMIKEIIKDTKCEILEDELCSEIDEIIVYGSFIENKMTFKSDIDVAVKFDKITLKESTLFRKRIAGRVNSRVDIQVYNNLPLKIQKEINKGKIIYKK